MLPTQNIQKTIHNLMFTAWICNDHWRQIKIIPPLTTVDLLVCHVPLKGLVKNVEFYDTRLPNI